MTKKRGRPPILNESKKRDKIFQLCLTDDERNLINEAAKASHLDTSAWVRSIILAEAEKII